VIGVAARFISGGAVEYISVGPIFGDVILHEVWLSFCVFTGGAVDVALVLSRVPVVDSASMLAGDSIVASTDQFVAALGLPSMRVIMGGSVGRELLVPVHMLLEAGAWFVGVAGTATAGFNLTAGVVLEELVRARRPRAGLAGRAGGFTPGSVLGVLQQAATGEVTRG
jgi:hypothetical protein